MSNRASTGEKSLVVRFVHSLILPVGLGLTVTTVGWNLTVCIPLQSIGLVDLQNKSGCGLKRSVCWKQNYLVIRLGKLQSILLT